MVSGESTAWTVRFARHRVTRNANVGRPAPPVLHDTLSSFPLMFGFLALPQTMARCGATFLLGLATVSGAAATGAAPSDIRASGVEPFPEPGQSRVTEILNIIRDEGDKAPRALYEELGKIGTPKALFALEKSLRELDLLWSKRSVFAAMGLFLDDDALRPKVLITVERFARSNDSIDARAAAGALAGFGPRAYDALYDVVRGARIDLARAHAVRGLTPEFKRLADAKSLELVLDWWSTPQSGSRDQALELFRVFKQPKDIERMARYIAGKKVNRALAQTIVVAMEGHPRGVDVALDEAVDKVFLKAAQSDDDSLRYFALQAMRTRGGTGNTRLVEKLADDPDPSVRRIAVEILMRSRVSGYGPFELAERSDPVARQAAAIGLAEDGSTLAIEALHVLLVDENQTVRAVAIRQVGRRRDRSSIPELISRLASERGRLRGDAWYVLTMLTGMDLGKHAGSWKTFWRMEGETFKVPSFEVATKAAEERAARKTVEVSRVSFYGLDVLSDRFALVIDTSGSMTAVAYAGKTRIEIAKEQLSQTLSRIRDGVLFNIIPFDGRARPMEDGLIAMDDVERENSAMFIESQVAAGGTNIYSALAAAFEDERVDTIYLLSDGATGSGKITGVQELRDEVARWNSVRGIVIHCIAVGQDHPLLKGLASDSGGKYVRVD